MNRVEKVAPLARKPIVLFDETLRDGVQCPSVTDPPIAEKIRIGVNAMAIEMPGGASRPSLSIGVVAYPEDGRTADELIISADGALYLSKRAGKDRVTGVPMPGTGRASTPV